MKNQTNLSLRSREEFESQELENLAPYAAPCKSAHGTRLFDESEHPYRTAFQRDRDRIIHCRAFRRLKHKRQVFLPSEGDHYRTRITHTLEVAQLSRTMSRVLGLNEDLVEAIALGHDLGHTPFGHLGEVILNGIMTGKSTFKNHNNSQNFGGFKHNYQSVRVVDDLEQKYACNGLNLTAPVREGILKHTRLKRGAFNFPDFKYEGLLFEIDTATTLEGQVVAICDEIAQRTHDLEDGIRAKLVDIEQIRELKIIQQIEKNLQLSNLLKQDRFLYQNSVIGNLINYLVNEVVHFSLENIKDFIERKNRSNHFNEELIRFSPEIDPLQKELNKFIYHEIINYSRVQWSDELGKRLIYRLFEAYYLEPELLPDYVLKKLVKTVSPLDVELRIKLQNDGSFFRVICDYIAGMTDYYAIREADRLSDLNKFDKSDLQLDFALGIRGEH